MNQDVRKRPATLGDVVAAQEPLMDEIIALEKKVAQLGAGDEWLARINRLKAEAESAIDRDISNAELILLGYANSMGTQTEVINGGRSRIFMRGN
jgi:hypothetical protein